MDGTDTLNTGSVTTGPTTFSDVSWSDAPSASTPASETPAASTSADATDPPAEATSPDGTTPAQGEPPKERWSDILANARAKEREAALNEWRQQHGWAEQVDQREFQQIQRIARAVSNGDKVAGLQQLISEISREDPNFQAQLRSYAGRLLAQRAQQQPEQEPQPDLPIQLEDGRVVHLYSAEQQAKREAFLQKQWRAQVQQDIAPLQQTHEQLQAERKAIAQRQEIAADVESALATASKWKRMDDPTFRQKVAERLQQIQVASDDKRDVQLAFHDAYLAVRDLDDQALSTKAESGLLDKLQKQAAASTGINPGTAAASTPRRIDSFHQLGPEAWR
jgi:hypothetical protein